MDENNMHDEKMSVRERQGMAQSDEKVTVVMLSAPYSLSLVLLHTSLYIRDLSAKTSLDQLLLLGCSPMQTMVKIE